MEKRGLRGRERESGGFVVVVTTKDRLWTRGKGGQFLSAARNEHADLQVHFVLPFFLSSVKRLKEAFRGQKSTGTWVIEATDFRIEVRSDL